MINTGRNPAHLYFWFECCCLCLILSRRPTSEFQWGGVVHLQLAHRMRMWYPALSSSSAGCVAVLHGWSLCFSANFSSWSASCTFGDQTCSLASIQAMESNLFQAQHPLLLQYVDLVHASSLTQKSSHIFYVANRHNQQLRWWQHF